MFEVHGGVFTDMTFAQVEPGTEEYYGPFETREEAVLVWRGKMGNQIDTCEHRLFVKKIVTSERERAITIYGQPDEDGHVTRFSDSSLYDEVCVLCRITDREAAFRQPCRVQ